MTEVLSGFLVALAGVWIVVGFFLAAYLGKKLGGG